MKPTRFFLALAVLLGAALVVGASSCGATSPNDFGSFGGHSAHTSGHAATGSVTSGPLAGSSSASGNLTGGGGSGGGTGQCVGLQCQIHACPGGGSTTITGTIYDPAGKNPLYGIVAYVPNTPPKPLLLGASCYTCGDLYTGNPIAAAVTDASGKFTIKDAPDGTDIPLVIQVGKWRRQFVIPAVTACTDNQQMDKTLLLPKNHSEGDVPNIAISTGGADTLECLLSRIGLDQAEYTAGDPGPGHIHIFQGDGPFGSAPNTSPGAPDPAAALWNSQVDIMQYDIVLLSCEGHETTAMNQQVLFDYAAAGGRVFASHFHYAWFNTGPFGNANLATWSPGSNSIGGSLNATIVTTNAGQPFPRGQALFQWLTNVNALTNGELPIQAPRHNADVSVSNTPSQPWIVADQNAQAPGATQDFTFDTPLGVPAAKQCGRVVYSDMHVGAASGDYMGASSTVPTGCGTNDLSPQEKALEFIFFDLSSCVTPNNMPMQPPPPIPK